MYVHKGVGGVIAGYSQPKTRMRTPHPQSNTGARQQPNTGAILVSAAERTGLGNRIWVGGGSTGRGEDDDKHAKLPFSVASPVLAAANAENDGRASGIMAAATSTGVSALGAGGGGSNVNMNLNLSRKLASMIGHKSMASFHSIGGHDGLLTLLGVDPENGLTSSFPSSSSNAAEASKGSHSKWQDNHVQIDQIGEGDCSSNAVEVQRRRYGRNAIPQSDRLSFMDFVKESFDDRTMQILVVAALVSLVIGMTTPDPRTGEVDHATGWIEGFAILVSVGIVTVVTSLNNYRKQEQFAELMARGNQLQPVVVRRNFGRVEEIHDEDVVVGDIVLVSQGMQLSFDAILLEGKSIVCDEGNVTGENDDVPKSVATDPFLISGSSVLEGSTDGVAVVCAVGETSFCGEITMAIHSTEKKNTPLQDQLSGMANTIGKFGLAAAVFTFVALFVKELYVLLLVGGRFFAIKFFENITTAIAIVVVAVPEGLPLSVTIALAYSMRRMLGEGNLVRHLAACETMGGATVLCSDKTGTLTVPVMKLKRLYIEGEDYDNLDRKDTITVNASVTSAALLLDCLALNAGGTELAVTRNKTSEAMLPLCHRLRLTEESDFRYSVANAQSIARDTSNVVRFPFNSNWKQSAVIVRLHIVDDGLLFAMQQREKPQERSQRSRSPFKATPSGNGMLPRLQMAVTGLASNVLPSTALPTATDLAGASGQLSVLRQFVVGAAETVLEQCTSVTTQSGNVQSLTPELRKHYNNILTSYTQCGLRVVCCAFVDAYVEDSDTACRSAGEPVFSGGGPGLPTHSLLRPMTLVGVIGLEETIRSEVPASIAKCRTAGLRVVMITGDAVFTAVNIADRCGMFIDDESGDDAMDFPMNRFPTVCDSTLTAGTENPNIHGGICGAEGLLPGSPTALQKCGLVIDGPTFRSMSDDELVITCIPTLKVLARATPLDKKRLLQLIKHKYPLSVIAVTGDGTNDAPALKLSDVGFAMNSGSDVAKRASDIVLLSNSFEGMVKATMWGRSVKDNIRKFLQFQLTVNLVACAVSFCGAVMNDQNLSPLKPVQLLWLNLIMDTLAALALATELPYEAALLSRPPEPKDVPIIMPRMWFAIGTQSVFQFICQVLLLGYAHRLFARSDMLTASDSPASLAATATVEQFGPTHLTIVFNTFVWLQIFNFFNARLLNKEEQFCGRWKDSYVLLCIVAFIAGVQVLVVQHGGIFMSTAPLNREQWAFCVLTGSLSLIVGAVSRWLWWNGHCGGGTSYAPLEQGDYRQSDLSELSRCPGGRTCLALVMSVRQLMRRLTGDRYQPQRDADSHVL